MTLEICVMRYREIHVFGTMEDKNLRKDKVLYRCSRGMRDF